MATADWRLEGDYMEACNCDFLCPCITTELKAVPTEGHCAVALAFHITRGHYGDIRLDDLNFILAADAPGPMADGNWTVGLILDARADEAQRTALSEILSGQAGGPMERLGALIGNFAGIEQRPITFEKNGLRRRLEVPGLIDIAIAGMPGATGADAPICIDNAPHPANTRLALARAERAQASAFGITWSKSGNNGHFAPFAWQP